MKEFEPSNDFVSRVMREVHACERANTAGLPLFERLLASRPFRYALSGGGALMGIFAVPARCI